MLRFSHVSDLLALVKNLTSSSRANPKDRIICWEKPEESVLRGHWSDEKQRRSAPVVPQSDQPYFFSNLILYLKL